MFKLAVVAAILPAVSWWCTTHFAQAAIPEPAAYALSFRRPAISQLSSEIARLPRVPFK